MTPWSPPGSFVHEISSQEYWNGLPCLSPGDLPNPEIEPSSPASQADSLPAEPLGKPLLRVRHVLYIRYKGEGDCQSSKAKSVIGWGLEHGGQMYIQLRDPSFSSAKPVHFRNIFLL